MDYSLEQIQQALTLLDASKAIGQKHDLSPAAGVAPYAHGNGGLFNTPGVDMRVFSALQLPMSGLIDALPVMPPGTSVTPGSEYAGHTTPFYDTVTGVTAGNADSWANQPDATCDDPPEPGLMKLCTLTAPYGRFYGKIRALDSQQVGLLTNRGEPTDLRLANQYDNTGFIQAQPFGVGLMGGAGGLNSDLSIRLFESAISWKRMQAELFFTGSPANNKAGGGAKQFMGLDLLINTGNKVDAFTATVCTALNSDIKDFTYNLVNGNGKSIVTYLDMMIHYLEWNAQQSGLDPVTFAIVMRPEAFDEITKVWSIRYYEEALTAMANYTNGRAVVDARDSTNARDDMRNNLYLPIRGKRVRVILDNTIPEDTPTQSALLRPGQYASDIYVVPLTVLGGIPVTYLEALNYDATRIQEVTSFLGLDTSLAYRTSDAGRFLWWSHRYNTCLDFRYVTSYRLILRTPQLAGRVNNVAYQPLQHTQDWNPSSPYHTDGGRTNTAVNRYYTEWSGTSTPVVVG